MLKEATFSHLLVQSIERYNKLQYLVLYGNPFIVVWAVDIEFIRSFNYLQQTYISVMTVERIIIMRSSVIIDDFNFIQSRK